MNNPSQQQLTPDTENLGINQLNELGNHAIKQGLIAGHGHHQGQYEIIREGKILTMPPKEALTFLQQLTQPEIQE
ncbi:MAG: hypothetical protein AAGC93_20795 [Cyanobacteria bacterium P01_F01_bin.53]